MDESRLCLEGFQQVFGCDRFRRELDHDLTATDCDVFLIKRIERLLAFFASIHQIGIAQDGEVMRNGGLRVADLCDDVADREFAATAGAHNALTGFVGDGFGKEDRVEFHKFII